MELNQNIWINLAKISEPSKFKTQNSNSKAVIANSFKLQAQMMFMFSFKGTTHDVLQEIAPICGMKCGSYSKAELDIPTLFALSFMQHRPSLRRRINVAF